MLSGTDRPMMEVSNRLMTEPVELRLLRQKKDLEESLSDVNSAIKALEENPKMLEVLNLLRRVGI